MAILALAIYSLGFQRGEAQESSYPESPARVLVGFPPGSGPDLVARTEAVTRSEPNGYTLLLATSAQMTISPALSSDVRVDPRKELLPITLAASNALLLLVPRTSQRTPFMN
jgi:tripartite-type tricarboxylate transporter receptor subunit TctC